MSNYDTNEIYISGKIVSEPVLTKNYYGEGFYEFKVEAERLSGRTDVLPFMVSERLTSDVALKEGTSIAVAGEIRTYNRIEDGKSRLFIHVFVSRFVDLPDREMNRVLLSGYICKPPVFRLTPEGREITDILLAVNRRYGKSSYVPIIAWGRNARFCGNLPMGVSLSIEGRFQSRLYKKKLSETEIEQRVAYEVSAGQVAVEDGFVDESWEDA